jgi:hypothetical protein
MADEKHPWQNEAWLKERYVEQNLKVKEIAENCGCHPMTISRWIDRHGLVKKYRREDWLREKYNEERMNLVEMAEEANTNPASIGRYMRKHGIQTRGAESRPATYIGCGSKGYEIWQCAVNRDYVKVHRLLAVAEYGFESVAGLDVHHKNNIPFDNRADNIEVMTHEEHRSRHKKYTWLDKLSMKEMHSVDEASLIDVGKAFDVSSGTVNNAINELNSETPNDQTPAKERGNL